MKNNPTQEENAGCGVSCVAYIVKRSYKHTLLLFDKPEDSIKRGYYCKEIVKALDKAGYIYKFSHVNSKNKKLLKMNNVIVFIERSKEYPMGHYLVKTKHEWFNSWINFPCIKPAKSGYNKRLPGKAQWIIYPINT